MGAQGRLWPLSDEPHAKPPRPLIGEELTASPGPDHFRSWPPLGHWPEAAQRSD